MLDSTHGPHSEENQSCLSHVLVSVEHASPSRGDWTAVVFVGLSSEDVLMKIYVPRGCHV